MFINNDNLTFAFMIILLLFLIYLDAKKIVFRIKFLNIKLFDIIALIVTCYLLSTFKSKLYIYAIIALYGTAFIILTLKNIYFCKK